MMNRFFTLLLAASCLTAVGQVPDYVPTDGLVGWWPFEGSLENFGSNGDEGLAYDGGEGIAFGTTFNLDRFSNPGSALQIEYGSYAYLGLDFALELTPTDTMTIAFWSKPDTNEVVVLTKYQNGNLNSSWFVANYWSEGVRAIGNGTSGTPNENQWYSMCPNPTNGWAHAVVVFRGGTTSLWVNGTSICEVTNPVSAGEQTQPVLVGRSNCPGLNGHTECNNSSGCFDDLGFWNRALSSEEILGLYLAAPPVLGCMDPEACNFDDEAVLDDGSCISCDFIATFCGVGTIWDSAAQTCIGDGSGDINLDGCVQLNDLLDLLSAYGDCGSEESPWQCGDPLEYQGYDYETVQIGEQCWFAENVRYLPAVSPVLLGSEDDGMPHVGMPHAYVYGYDGANTSEAVLEPNYQTYGGLYNYEAVQAWGLCPTGWSIPNQIEWDILTTNNSVVDCASNSWFGSNVTGLDLLPGGDRDGVQGANAFNNLGSSSLIWLEGDNPESPVEVGVHNESWYIYGIQSTSFGLSVRCIKDSE